MDWEPFVISYGPFHDCDQSETISIAFSLIAKLLNRINSKELVLYEQFFHETWV